MSSITLVRLHFNWAIELFLCWSNFYATPLSASCLCYPIYSSDIYWILSESFCEQLIIELIVLIEILFFGEKKFTVFNKSLEWF